MGSVVLQGATSGATTITPTDAVTVTVTLPSTGGTLQTSGSGYTTNGVAYATSTSALATGGSFTFNGSATSPVVTVASTSTTASSQNFTTNSAAQRTTIGVEQSTGGGLFVGSSAYAAVFGSAGASSTQFASNNNVRMTIDSSGNVGIGTTSPASILHVSGTGSIITKVQSTSSAASLYLIADTQAHAGYGAIQLGDGTNWNWAIGGGLTTNVMTFSTGGTEAVRIDSSGNLLVGTTSNIAKLGVVFDGSVINGCVLRTSTNASGTGFLYFQQDINTCGSVVRVGTTSAVNYNSTSDYRLKENAIPLTNAIETISKLKPITFDWIADKSSAVGFFAHEFQEVIPLSVIGQKDAVDSNGNPIYQQMDNSGAIPYLVKAIQELNTLVTTQSAEIAALKAKVGV
jgi:hypothetical protein